MAGNFKLRFVSILLPIALARLGYQAYAKRNRIFNCHKRFRMSEFAASGLFANGLEHQDVRRYVTNVFGQMEEKDNRFPEVAPAFGCSSPEDNASHIALATMVALSALPSRNGGVDSLGQGQMESWRANNPNLTHDQVKAYGSIAAGLCISVGLEDQAYDIIEHTRHQADSIWPQDDEPEEQHDSQPCPATAWVAGEFESQSPPQYIYGPMAA